MIILVNVQCIGKKQPIIKAVPMEIAEKPETVEALIILCVKTCVAQQTREKNIENTVLSAEEIGDLAAMGKIAFDMDFNSAPVVDERKAIVNALQCYEDGLFRIFLNGIALGDLHDKITINNQDVLTFVRLTMLSGGGW